MTTACIGPRNPFLTGLVFCVLKDGHTLSNLSASVPHVGLTGYQGSAPENPVDLSSSRAPPIGSDPTSAAAALLAHHHAPPETSKSIFTFQDQIPILSMSFKCLHPFRIHLLQFI